MLNRVVSFASVGLLVSAFAGSASAERCTQHNPSNQAGALARVAGSHVVPYGASCHLWRRHFVYSWGCAGGLCAVSVDQSFFPVTVPTESLRFRPWKVRYNFFPLPL
jgi:hypothetical protein